MPRKATSGTSCGTEQDEHPSKYDLRKRTGRGMVSADKKLQDARHDTLVGRTKRTTTNTRTRSSSSRGSVSKRTGVLSGQRWARRNKKRLWLAEAILKENDTQYLIEYAPVYEGAQREISWQPKYYANAALVRDWEERKMAIAHGDSNAGRGKDPSSTKNEDGAGQRNSLMADGGQPQTPVTDHQSLERYGTESEKSRQYSASFVDERTPGGFGEGSHNTQLKATNPIIPEILGTLVPGRNVPVAHMYESAALKNQGAAHARPYVKYGRNLAAAVEDNRRRDEPQPPHNVALEVRSSEPQPSSPEVASSAFQHPVKSASSQQLPMTGAENSVYALTTTGIGKLGSFLVEAATKCVSQNSGEKTSASDTYGVQSNDYSRVEGSTHNQDGLATRLGDQGKLPPRPGTRISTLLSPAPSTFSNNGNQDHRAALPVGIGSGQASQRALALVAVSENRNIGVPSTGSGKLASAKGQLRSLLRESRRRRFQRTGLHSPPSP